MSGRKSKSLLPKVSVSLVRSWNRLLYLRYDPTHGIAAILIVILGFLILAPIISMIMEAFLVQFRDATRIGKSVGEFTI